MEKEEMGENGARVDSRSPYIFPLKLLQLFAAANRDGDPTPF
jgi:hypothetical protein